MQFRILEVAGLVPSLLGMRFPHDSKNDTTCRIFNSTTGNITYDVEIGEKDLRLAKSLIEKGTDHAKFLRQIQVWVNVEAPRYFWQEADTYKFGTKNSQSTMHRLFTKNPITLEQFEYDVKDEAYMKACITYLNSLREEYLETKDYNLVLRAKKILPEGYLQMRLWNTNYAELMNIYKQRKGHKLPEWSEFITMCEQLPYFKELCMN